MKRPENASPGEVLKVTAYLPANTPDVVRGRFDPSISSSGSFDSSISGSLTATSLSSIDGDEGSRVPPSGDEHSICDGDDKQSPFDSLLNAVRFQRPQEISEEFAHVLHDIIFGENDIVLGLTRESSLPFLDCFVKHSEIHRRWLW